LPRQAATLHKCVAASRGNKDGWNIFYKWAVPIGTKKFVVVINGLRETADWPESLINIRVD